MKSRSWEICIADKHEMPWGVIVQTPPVIRPFARNIPRDWHPKES